MLIVSECAVNTYISTSQLSINWISLKTIALFRLFFKDQNQWFVLIHMLNTVLYCFFLFAAEVIRLYDSFVAICLGYGVRKC